MQRPEYCNEFSCSAFNNVSLVLGLTAIERIPLLFGYKDWFANVHLLVPQKECEECRCLVSRANAERVSCHCRDDFKDNTDHASISLAIESVVAMEECGASCFSTLTSGSTCEDSRTRPWMRFGRSIMAR